MELLKLLKFNPIVWLAVLAVSWLAYLVRINPFLDFPFKIGYDVLCFALGFVWLAFENWQLKTAKPDWKDRYKEMELKK